MKLISVVIIAYNMENYLGRAIESVEQQTYSNLEIIVVDDGSSDNTLKISEKYALKDNRVKVIHQKNKGQAAARQTGALNAKGDYIGFMDADDTIASDMYELLLSNALKYDADISHCGYTMIRTDGERKDFYGSDKLVIQDHNQGLIDLIEGKFIEPTTCTKLYRRRLFIDVPDHTDIRINEDLLMNYYLFANAEKSVFQDVCKYNYFKRDGSMSRAITARQFTDPIIVKKRICNAAEKEDNIVFQTARTGLVSQYISNCYSIKENGFKEFNSIYLDNKRRIKENYKSCRLSRNDCIKAKIILYFPLFCKLLHNIYRLKTRRKLGG